MPGHLNVIFFRVILSCNDYESIVELSIFVIIRF